MFKKKLLGKLKGRGHLEDLFVNGRVRVMSIVFRIGTTDWQNEYPSNS